MGRQYTESVGGKQQKGLYVISYSYEGCLEMGICWFVPWVWVNFFLFMDMVVGLGGDR